MTSSADARGGPIIAKGPPPLRTPADPSLPTDNSSFPSLKRQAPAPPRERSPAPSARAARRALARTGRGPTWTASPPLKRTSAEPSVRNRAVTGGRGTRRAPVQTRAAAARPATHRRRRGQASKDPSRSSQAAISRPVHGRSSTEAHGTEAARPHVAANRANPAPAAFATSGAAGGTSASAPHKRKPPPSSGPDSGMRTRLASGPTRDTRPNTPIHKGSRATATARLHSRRIAAPRASPGHDAGAAASARAPAHRIAAQAPTLIRALGDSAAPGSRSRSAAAANVSAAEPVVSRPSAREASAAPSIARARTHGGSAPAIKV